MEVDDEFLRIFAALGSTLSGGSPKSRTKPPKRPVKKPVESSRPAGSSGSGSRKPKYDQQVEGTIAYIKSPETGRQIVVNGPAYKSLIRQSKYSQASLQALPRFFKSPPSKAGSDETYTPDEIAEIARKMEFIRAGSGQGSGSWTRGWDAVKPKTKAARRAVKEKCGDKCFLRPSDLGFPVCRKLDSSETDCKADCRGILSAKSRARQWKYHDIAEAAQELGHKGNCGWADRPDYL